MFTIKATFNNFITENPNCSKYDGNVDAITVFNILSKDQNIIGMIDASEAGKPALSACANEIEAWFDNQLNPSIDFNDGFTRTAVGRMVKSILEPFGYKVTVQKDLPKASKGKYFTSASCYQKKSIASMKIIRIISPDKMGNNIYQTFVYHKISNINPPFWGLTKNRIDQLEIQTSGNYLVRLDYTNGSVVLTSNQVKQIISNKLPASDGDYKITANDLKIIGINI